MLLNNIICSLCVYCSQCFCLCGLCVSPFIIVALGIIVCMIYITDFSELPVSVYCCVIRDTYRDQWPPFNVCCYLNDQVCAHLEEYSPFLWYVIALRPLEHFWPSTTYINTASIRPEERILPLFYSENGHSSQPVSIVAADPCYYYYYLFALFSVQNYNANKYR